MDFESCFKVHNLVSGYPKGMNPGQVTNLNVIFHFVVSLSIGYNLKLAPVPCWILEWPIEINVPFLLNEHGDPQFLFHNFNENNTLNKWEKN